MKVAAFLFLLAIVGAGAAHANCRGPENDRRVIYGGKPPGSEAGLKLVCAEATRSGARYPRAVEVAKVGAPVADVRRLDAMDKDGVSLILARELAQTEAELISARRQDNGQSDAMRGRIHRLEKDLEALQGEISRLHKR